MINEEVILQHYLGLPNYLKQAVGLYIEFVFQQYLQELAKRLQQLLAKVEEVLAVQKDLL